MLQGAPDFSRIYWETGSGDILKYFSKLGRLGTYDDQGDFGRRGDRMHAESWRSMIRDGIDPFEAALSHAHDLGMELHASYRVAGFHYPPPLDYNSQGPTFYKFSPRLRSTDKMGAPRAPAFLRLPGAEAVRHLAPGGDGRVRRGGRLPAVQPEAAGR